MHMIRTTPSELGMYGSQISDEICEPKNHPACRVVPPQRGAVFIRGVKNEKVVCLNSYTIDLISIDNISCKKRCSAVGKGGNDDSYLGTAGMDHLAVADVHGNMSFVED